MLETVVYGGLEWELFAQREREFTRRKKWAFFFERDVPLPEKKEMTFEEHCERLATLPAINKLPGNISWRAPYFWEINRLHIDGLQNRLNPQQMRLWRDMFSSYVGEWYNHGISGGIDDFTLYLDARDENSKFATLRHKDCFLYRAKQRSIFDATPLFHMLFYHCLSSQLPAKVSHEYALLPPPSSSRVHPAGRPGNTYNCCLTYHHHPLASRAVRELKSYGNR